MDIRRNEVTLDNAIPTLYFDFLLDNEEALTAEAIAAIGADAALAIPPPFGEIVALLIAADAAEIQANNKGNGVGANINANALVGVFHKSYFPR